MVSAKISRAMPARSSSGSDVRSTAITYVFTATIYQECQLISVLIIFMERGRPASNLSLFINVSYAILFGLSERSQVIRIA